jgi:hypothetical protein
MAENEVNEIKATKKLGDIDKEATILYDFGGSLAAATEKFGEAVVYSGFVRSAVITAQAAMRRFLEDGLDGAAIEEKMAAWKPGVSIERVIDPVAATVAKFGKMTKEEQDALIETLMAKATGA